MNEREIFNNALELSLAARKAYLDAACGDDAPLRKRVVSLLDAGSNAGDFLEIPPTGFALTLQADSPETSAQSLADLSLEFLTPSDKPGCLGTMGHYEVVGLVGQGGFGIVLRAYDSRLNRVVAIKVMAPQLAMNPTAVKRFLREAQAAAAVRHDHVVTIHAIEASSRPPFIVMELIDGVTLKEKVDSEGALDLIEILKIGEQIATGLAAAHAQGLVHRDIKPANILLENGIKRVKITDFGLARAVDDIGMTQTGMLAGTPLYMSPEQSQGQPIDARSDLFSLGSVLYTLCTGRGAFRADSAVATLRRVCDEAPKSIRKVNPEIPVWLELIVMRLLAKSPDERFQTASEVAELFQDCAVQLQNAGQDSAIRLPQSVMAFSQDDGLHQWMVGSLGKRPRLSTDNDLGAWFVALLCFQVVGLFASTIAALCNIESVGYTGPVFCVGLATALVVTAWRGRLARPYFWFVLSSIGFAIFIVAIINLFGLRPGEPGGMVMLILLYTLAAVPSGVWLIGSVYVDQLNSSQDTLSFFRAATGALRDQAVFARMGLVVTVATAFGVAVATVEYEALVMVVPILGAVFGALTAAFSVRAATHVCSRVFAFAMAVWFGTLVILMWPAIYYSADWGRSNEQMLQLTTLIVSAIVIPIGLVGFAKEFGASADQNQRWQFDLRGALVGITVFALAFALAKPCMGFGNVAHAGGVLFVLTFMFAAAILLSHLRRSGVSVFKRRLQIGLGLFAVLAPSLLMAFEYDRATARGSFLIRTNEPVQFAIYDKRLSVRYINTATRDKEQIFRGRTGDYELEILTPASLEFVSRKATLQNGRVTEVRVRKRKQSE